ncbi:hypothetical protein VTO42DRAFT_1764 [Malbranchea cinnamomea]
MAPPRQIIIIGPGISGLLLAQYLRKTGVPFQMFERDSSLEARPGGWGLTLHWSLPALRRLLPPDIVQQLPEAYVNKEAARNGDNDRYQFFDLSTGKAKYDVPAAERIRVSRYRLRRILATGIDVQWSKSVESIDSSDDSVTVHFVDGTNCTGTLLAACDGAHSRIRKVLYNATMNPIPVRLLSAATRYSAEQAAAACRIDPYIFQGTHSKDNTYLFFSFLDSPHNFSDSTDGYTCQVIISWPYRPGFFGEEAPIDIPASQPEQLALMKRFADDWAEPFRSLVHNLPDDVEIVPLSLEDWHPQQGSHGTGRIALIGDSAHTMTMFRGESANHAIVDVLDFVKHLEPHFPKAGAAEVSNFKTIRRAIDDYEDAVNARAIPSVLASRQACLDANEYARINDASPLVSRRIINMNF